jgi:transposase
MASIQSRMCRGHKYWYIVESRRVNGKPRPIVIESLGTTANLIARLQGEKSKGGFKPYSHGAVAALLVLAKKLDVVSIINKHTLSNREYWPKQPVRNDLTAGITLLLASIGRVCMPTSKRGWSDWSKTTSCDYLLRISSAKLDSQHFWDLMDCIPIEAIEKIELEILQNVLQHYPIDGGSLLYDTTNFYTFINSTNTHCTIPKRGKNKQKRGDLRQVGLALAVTEQHYIPLLHHSYQGNINDSKVFGEIIASIKTRMELLKIDTSEHTIVFDRGCNSKKNLQKVKDFNFRYIGALTPSHHKDLLNEAENKFTPIFIGDYELEIYRAKKEIWGEERTVLVFVSQRLKDGQFRGVHQALEKKEKRLKEIQKGLLSPRSRKRTREQIENLIQKLLKGQFMEGLITYQIVETTPGRWNMTYEVCEKQIEELDDKLGFRIVMTDRHDWTSEKIIKTFYDQSIVEGAFKNLKNPYHLAVTPGFHWTDQKIRIHYMICVLGYLLAALVWYDAKKAGMNTTLDNLLDSLNGIHLGRFVDMNGKQGRPKITYRLEDLSEDQKVLVDLFNLSEIHLKPLKIDGVSVYN